MVQALGPAYRMFVKIIEVFDMDGQTGTESREIREAITRSGAEKRRALPGGRHWHIPLLIGLICFAAAHLLALTRTARMVENRIFDWRAALRHGGIFASMQAPTHFRNPRVVIVPINDKTLDQLMEPTFFWSAHFASVFNALIDNGAAVIALDYQFQISPDEYIKERITGIMDRLERDGRLRLGEEGIGPYLPGTDMQLFLALRKGKTVLMTFLNEDGKVKRPYRPFAYAAGAVGPGKNLGLVNTQPDEDGVVRHQFLYKTGIDENGQKDDYFSLALLTAMKLTGETPGLDGAGGRITLGGKAIPTAGDRGIIINYAGPPGTFFSPHSFAGLVKKAREGDGEFFRKNFAGKAVLIGPAYTGSNDIAITPYSSIRTMEMFGVEVHANIVNTVINGDYIQPLPGWMRAVLLLIVSLTVSALCYGLRPLGSAAASLLVAAVLAGLSFFVFYSHNVWMPLAGPLGVMPLVFASVYSYRYVAEDRERRFIRQVLGRYISEAVAKEILKDPSRLELGGRRGDVTILFCDINDFTTFSEKTPPEEVIGILNEYFTRMEKVIFENRGTLKQFVGDEIMVICGAPQPDEGHPFQACLIACEMVKELVKWQEERTRAGKVAFDVKFGIHSGFVVAGNVGSPRRTEYTTIGDVVNTTSRIMGLTKQVGARILISEETYVRIKDRVKVEEKGTFPVKGKEQEVKVYELVSIA